ncbi:hypothetical protein K1719_020856 [Acacia pycnantha]|nr:hypothetical protein K1719_020856 [Acacia pycnantha]
MTGFLNHPNPIVSFTTSLPTGSDPLPPNSASRVPSSPYFPCMAFVGPPSNLMSSDPKRKNPESFTVPPPWVPFANTAAFRYFEIMTIFADSFSVENINVSDACWVGASINIGRMQDI